MHSQVNRVQGPQGNTDTLPTLPTLLMGADLTSKQRQLLPWTLGCSAEAVRGRAAAVDVQLMMELSPQKTIRSLNALSGNCTSSTLPREPHNTAMQGTAGYCRYQLSSLQPVFAEGSCHSHPALALAPGQSNKIYIVSLRKIKLQSTVPTECIWLSHHHKFKQSVR